MRHIQLITTNYLKLEYNALDNYLYVEWFGALENEAIIQGYDQTLYYLKKEHCQKLLDNHLEVEGIWADLAEWFAQDWHIRAEKAGLQYHAVVYSKSHFSRLSTDKAIKMVQTGIVEGFETVHEAEGWLTNL
ncbi:hypothetical protein POKO110462_09135 [Pontibacter korlensis]|uniref:STAS/SEC14 domain-containing protein n=1 Tax=Pontibacter korlensis TaxID=400092 RepID=A0A0E3ZCK8_9BACT|nr:hypothetical protein [Pontibacter korlensis]AKD02650.1 hypothetical protein PKOR_05330 [Pontibacter korlensis]